jgi:hypothetical protein
MSENATWILLLTEMVGVPQVLGFAISRLTRKAETRMWLGPVVAALSFAIGLYVAWSIPTQRQIAEGQRVCGAAGALLVVPLVVFVPANLVLGGVIQALAAFLGARRRSTPG